MEEMNPNDCLFASNQYAFSFTQLLSLLLACGYEAAGFVRYALKKEAATAIFMSKPLH